MSKRNIEYVVTRSFDSSKISLLERLIEHIEEQGETEDDNGKSKTISTRLCKTKRLGHL